MFWREIRKYIEDKKITQVWLSSETKIGQVKLNAILTGNRRMMAEDFVKICVALKVQPATFYPEEIKQQIA